MAGIRRRDMLRWAIASAGGAVVFTGCERLGIPEQELHVQSPIHIPEDVLVQGDAWYATVCRQCPAGCGTIVRVFEGRAKKVEGNPDYPVNYGKLCARGQSSVQELYHPDRLSRPLLRRGERFTGPLEPVTWDQALDELVRRLRAAGGTRGSTVFITDPLRGHEALVVRRFVEAFGAQHLTFAPLEDAVYIQALGQVFGSPTPPEFDIANARFILSFGADFLSTWQSPVRYNRGYGQFRQGRPGTRGYFVHVDSRFSMTAANADEWLRVRPGTEGALALSLAQVIISEGLGEPAAAQALTDGRGAAALDAYRPERVAEVTGVSAERIRSLARTLARERGLVIGGGSAGAHTNGLFNLTAILALNHLVGNVGRPGGVMLNPDRPLAELPPFIPPATLAEWEGFVQQLRGAGRPAVLWVHRANPVYGLPQATGFAEAVRQVPFIVSTTQFLDETAALADLILPIHNPLEEWGSDVPVPGPGFQVVGFQQPVVRPFFEHLVPQGGGTRSFTDLLLAVAEELGGPVQQALPWASTYELLRESARRLFETGRGPIRANDFESFWVKLLAAGGWWDEGSRVPAAPTAPAVTLPATAREPRFAGAEAEYPFYLVPFPLLSLNDGRGAHLPWLQATPDPLTTVTWATWVEISPQTAKELGIREGDVVQVESLQGTLKAPAYIVPPLPRDVIAIPIGQGHTAYTQFAKDRGANPLAILAPQKDEATGALAWAATRVRLRKVDRRQRLPKLEGNLPGMTTNLQMEDFPVVQVTTGPKPQ